MDKIEKGKIAIVNERLEILVLTRSDMEDTRQGECDLPGGKLNVPDIEVELGTLREAQEELPGTIVHKPIELVQPHRKINELGELVITHIFAATATFPPGGIILSNEHSAFEWLPMAEIKDLKTRPRYLPKKYRRAISSGFTEFDWLVNQATVIENRS